MTDYWSHFRWSRYAARSNYKVFLIGDSVIWGQEVDNDQTISHYLNEHYGEEIFANLGIDALFQSAFPGIIKYYSEYYSNLIIQFSPHWIRDVNNDLRGNRKRFYHPRLVPQFHPRIHYNDYTLNERLSYKLENYISIFSLVRHIMVNYFDNNSASTWMMEHPYQSPFGAVTFRAGEGMKEARGKGLGWETKNIKLQTYTYHNPEESIHWESFLKAIKILQKRDIRFFILLGPYNHYILTPESRESLYTLLDDVKRRLDGNQVPYFDAVSGFLPSEMFADACHLLQNGHDLLARELLKDTCFKEWMANLRD